MKRLVRFGLVGSWSLLLVLWTCAAAHAQFRGGGYNPSQNPAFSPYLNLRGSSQPGITYYGIVRPEVAFSNSLYQLQGQQQLLASGQEDLSKYTALPTTGHAAGFQTQSKYFMSLGGGGQGGQAGGSPGMGGGGGAAKGFNAPTAGR